MKIIKMWYVPTGTDEVKVNPQSLKDTVLLERMKKSLIDGVIKDVIENIDEFEKGNFFKFEINVTTVKRIGE